MRAARHAGKKPESTPVTAETSREMPMIAGDNAAGGRIDAVGCLLPGGQHDAVAAEDLGKVGLGQQAGGQGGANDGGHGGGVSLGPTAREVCPNCGEGRKAQRLGGPRGYLKSRFFSFCNPDQMVKLTPE